MQLYKWNSVDIKQVEREEEEYLCDRLLNAVAEHPHLKSITSHLRVSSKCFAALKTFKCWKKMSKVVLKVHKVELAGAQRHEDIGLTMQAMSAQGNLEHLDINFGVHNQILVDIASDPSVQNLKCLRNIFYMTDDDLTSIIERRWDTLEELELGSNLLTDQSYNQVAECHRLKVLRITHAVNFSAFRIFSILTNLTTLELIDVRYDLTKKDYCDALLSNSLPLIETLKVVHKNNESGDLFQALASACPNVKTLDLRNNDFQNLSDAISHILQTCLRLERLKIVCYITRYASLKLLPGCHKRLQDLKLVEFAGCHLADVNVKKLVKTATSLLGLMHAQTLFAKSSGTILELGTIFKELTFPPKHFCQLIIC